MICIEELKTRYEVRRNNAVEDNKPKEVDDGLIYTVISGKNYSEELSKALKRDVLAEKLHLKKKYMIAYNIVENKELKTYWKVDKKGVPGA